jgi:hypothetical protein
MSSFGVKIILARLPIPDDFGLMYIGLRLLLPDAEEHRRTNSPSPVTEESC